MGFNKKYSITIVCFCVYVFTSFSQINENFGDGDFINNPTWIGNTNDYSVVNNKLRSNNSIISSKYYLSTPNSLATNCQWEFFINLQLNTSSLNFTDVFLISNNSDLSALASINGYFLRFGGAKDEISLYKRSGTTETLLIDGRDAELNKSNNVYKIKIIRSNNQSFKLYTDSTGTGNLYQLRDTVLDNSFLSSTYFGVNIVHSTASFFQKHFFDDIYVGPILVDNVPPQLVSTILLDSNTLRLTFNENIDTSYAKNTLLYTINKINLPNVTLVTKVVPDKNNLNTLDLIVNPSILQRGTYTCFVSVAKDIVGNFAINLNQNFIVSTIEKFDLVFNEFMIDPTPLVGQADAEYIELFNRSGLDLDLKNCKISIAASGTNFKSVTTTSNILKADSFLILCDAADTGLIRTKVGMSAKIIGVSSLPALTNESAFLQLVNANDQIIAFIKYSDQWYQNDVKKEGGWSLEQIDPNQFCGEINNWKASGNLSGGTPGKINSVFKSNSDSTGPEIIKAIAITNDTLQVFFNEKLDPSVVDPNIYAVDKNIGTASAVFGYDFFTKSLKLKFSSAFNKNELYMLSIRNTIRDCQGNASKSAQTIAFALPLQAAANELIINEILFNAKTNGTEYIELYNNSANYFDLSQYAFAGYDSVKKQIKDVEKISSEGRLIQPYEYLLITKEGATVKQQFPKGRSDQFIDMPNFPSLDDDAESIYLLDLSNKTVDYLSYEKSWHYALLKSDDGVALERISSKLPSNEKSNWTSAPSTEDFGTPGYKNAQGAELSYNDGITFNANTFSPDNDGYNDLLIINYEFDNAAQSATADIYDASGIKVKNLANNIFISNKGTFVWDGIKNNNERATIGNYILVMQLNDDKGKNKIIKKLFAVGAKVN